jgi:hypothetical protein
MTTRSGGRRGPDVPQYEPPGPGRRTRGHYAAGGETARRGRCDAMTARRQMIDSAGPGLSCSAPRARGRIAGSAGVGPVGAGGSVDAAVLCCWWPAWRPTPAEPTVRDPAPADHRGAHGPADRLHPGRRWPVTAGKAARYGDAAPPVGCGEQVVLCSRRLWRRAGCLKAVWPRVTTVVGRRACPARRGRACRADR